MFFMYLIILIFIYIIHFYILLNIYYILLQWKKFCDNIADVGDAEDTFHMIQNANNNNNIFYFNIMNIFICFHNRIKINDYHGIENKSICQLIHIIQLLKIFTFIKIFIHIKMFNGYSLTKIIIYI